MAICQLQAPDVRRSKLVHQSSTRCLDERALRIAQIFEALKILHKKKKRLHLETVQNAKAVGFERWWGNPKKSLVTEFATFSK